MKFLAILKDSLMESVDSFLIYVTLGLSALVVLVAMTLTFAPKPGAEMIMGWATLPVSVDFSKIDMSQMTNRRRGPSAVMGAIRNGLQMQHAAPAAGQPDHPDSTFEVVIKDVVKDQGKDLPLVGMFLGLGRNAARKEISERFGLVGDTRIAEIVGEVEDGKEPNTYIVHARVTPAGRRIWPHDLSLFFGGWQLIKEGAPLSIQVYLMLEIVVNWVGAWVGLLVSIGLTAFFVPNMLRKGTVDMLLVKPISRPVLLFYKYLGGLVFIFLNTAAAVGGLWLALGLRSGLWGFGPLIAIPAITFFFAILYSVSVLVGVVTRNAIVCIVVTFFVWVVLWVIGVWNANAVQSEKLREITIEQKVPQAAAIPALAALQPAISIPGQVAALGPIPDEEWPITRVVRGLHFVLPRTTDLASLISLHLQDDLRGIPMFEQAKVIQAKTISWGETLTVSCVFIAVTLGLACWWFSTKDY
jgi:ABC-type transport system involved in multi-copper enzyme maturation permease subunit